MRFESHGVLAGCWNGALQASGQPPRLSVVHRGQVVAEAALRDAGSGIWAVTAALPASVIDDGVHSLLLVAGTAAGGDLLAEVAQLRAELDLLKREFRRFAAGG